MIDRETAKFFNIPHLGLHEMPGSPPPLTPEEPAARTWSSRPAPHAATFPMPSEKTTLVFDYPRHNVTGAAPQPGLTVAGLGVHDSSACLPKRPSIFPISPPPFAPIKMPEYFPNASPITKEPVLSTPNKVPEEVIKAPDLLHEAADTLKERATQRDAAAQGERSMKRTVDAFNALTGKGLTEAEGWEFMVLLKLVRGRQGAFRKDDYVDGAAYCALLGECESKADKK